MTSGGLEMVARSLRGERLTLGSRWETDSGLSVLTVTDDGGVVTRSPGERSSVSDLLLDVADNGSFRALRDREDVSDVKGGLLSAVDERSGGDSLGGDEGLLAELVSVRVTEDNGSEGSTTRGLVGGLTGVTTSLLHPAKFPLAPIHNIFALVSDSSPARPRPS